MNNEVVEKEGNQDFTRKEVINKNAKKSWKNGGVFAALAVLVYALYVLSDYLVQAAIKALQVIKDDPSAFYRASTDNIESFFDCASVAFLVALTCVFTIKFIYLLSVSQNPIEKRGVLQGFLFGLGVIVGVTIAVGVKMFGIVETMWIMDFALGFVPGFFAAKSLDKLFVKLSRGKIAEAEKTARKADTVALFVALGAFIIQLGVVLCFCIGSGSVFGFALAAAYLFDSILSFAAFVTIATVYAVRGGAPSPENK